MIAGASAAAITKHFREKIHYKNECQDRKKMTHWKTSEASKASKK